MNDAFVHLKLHSEYSIVDGLIRINDLIKQTKLLQMSAVALTDQGNIFGLVKFYQKAIAAGIKPIIGADVILAENNDLYFITLLCMNQPGYRNLLRLLSEGYVNGQNNVGQPTLQLPWLQKANEGLIVLSGGRKGDVGSALLAKKNLLAEQRLQTWLQYFPSRYYLELQRTGRAQEEEYIQAAVGLAEKFNVPVVATNDVRFIAAADFEAHEARVCINSGTILQDASRSRDYSEQQYLRAPEEMQTLFSDIPEALENAVQISKRCNVQLSLNQHFFPNFPVPEQMPLEIYIKQQAEAGLHQRLQQTRINKEDHEKYFQRLQTELDVINRMGFPGYFLIVADFIRWAKEHEIPVGPGRGSGAGSLVAYALGITGLDPLKHELLFERFLNPERISMPDFDVDFCMEKRDRVIEYVAQRYGRDAVSQIITYGSMAAKAVVRDVGRVLGMPYGFVDKIAKLIPFELGMTLDKALEQEAELAKRYQQEEEVSTLMDLAKKLEGLTRNAGKHAGGVVIAPTKLTDFVPLYCEPGGEGVVTQFDKDDVEAVGLVKFDFLGLRTLTIIDWTLQAVNNKRCAEEKEAINILDVPLNDKKTFALLQDCQTTAVFQLESRGMKDLIRRLRPDSFDDITALVALFRPGPLQSGMVDDYIDRKQGRAPVYYPHPDLEGVLRSTYGVILYQEQVMQIAQTLAGYTLAGADILRSAMGKKKPAEMAKQREVFITGATQRGIEQSTAESIFDLMEKFAGYGFNKSHSAAYALIAYQTAWLKAHYPAEFMAAVLSSDMDHTDKVVGFLQECHVLKIKVLPPDINVGYHSFTVNSQDEIIYGLGAIKGVGAAAAQHIVEEREKNGEFSDLFSFCQRLDMKKVNRRVLEPLIRSGALDIFQISRASLMASIDKAMKLAERTQQNLTIGQTDLFAADHEVSKETYVEAKPWNDLIRLQAEKDTLGLYFSGHPIQAYEKALHKLITAPLHQLKRYRRKSVVIAGLLVSIRTMFTRNNKPMAVIALEDRHGRIDVTLFNSLYESIRANLEKDAIYLVKGKVETDEFTGGVRILAETIEPWEQKRQQMVKRLIIKVSDKQQVEELIEALPRVIESHRGGNCPIAIAYSGEQASAQLLLGEAWRVKAEIELLDQLKHWLGEEQVIVEY